MRGAENNPERAVENYVAFQNSHNIIESSEDKLSRERSRSRERDENKNDSPRKEEHIDLTSDNEKVQVDEKSEQTKVPTRERSRSRDRHEGQNVEHQNPPAEPDSKECVNLLSGNDDDSLDIQSLTGMLNDENEENLPDDQLVVASSNVNIPQRFHPSSLTSRPANPCLHQFHPDLSPIPPSPKCRIKLLPQANLP